MGVCSVHGCSSSLAPHPERRFVRWSSSAPSSCRGQRHAWDSMREQAVASDLDLGGRDFDSRLVEYCQSEGGSMFHQTNRKGFYNMGLQLVQKDRTTTWIKLLKVLCEIIKRPSRVLLLQIPRASDVYHVRRNY